MDRDSSIPASLAGQQKEISMSKYNRTTKNIKCGRGTSSKPNGFVIYNQKREQWAEEYQEYMRPVMEDLIEEGKSTYGISLWLISNGYKTIRGKSFTGLLVWQLLEKLGLKTQWAAPAIGYNNPNTHGVSSHE